MALVYTHSASIKHDKNEKSQHMFFSHNIISMLFQQSIITLQQQMNYQYRSNIYSDDENLRTRRNTGVPEQLLSERKQQNIQDFDNELVSFNNMGIVFAVRVLPNTYQNMYSMKSCLRISHLLNKR